MSLALDNGLHTENSTNQLEMVTLHLVLYFREDENESAYQIRSIVQEWINVFISVCERIDVMYCIFSTNYNS